MLLLLEKLSGLWDKSVLFPSPEYKNIFRLFFIWYDYQDGHGYCEERIQLAPTDCLFVYCLHVVHR
jgi:hypothetical protein